MINIVIKKTGLFYKSFVTVEVGDKVIKAKLTRNMFNREKAIEVIANKICLIMKKYKGASINIGTNVDPCFRYDLLFELRTMHHIDLQECA